MTDTTKKPDDTEEQEEEKRGYVPITRRNVMKSVGAVGVLGGYAGTAGASVPPDCTCEGLGGAASRCFEPDEDCSFCKIDDSVLRPGQTCTVPGTGITVTRESEDCISWNDPNNEIDDVALKAGSGDGSCTRLSEFGTDENGQLCTQDGKDISHITFRHSCDDGNGGPTPSGEILTCTTAKVDVTGLPANEQVTLTVSFYDCADYDDTFTADGDGNVTASIDLTAVGRCYCTPTEMTLTDSSGNTLVDSFPSGLDEGFCEPTVDADGDCSTVTATVSDTIAGCPIKATLSFVEDGCGDMEYTFNSDGSHDFEVPCYCTPDEVVFSYDAGSQTVDVTPDEVCEVTLTKVDADCESVTVTGTGVPGCPVTVDVVADCDIAPKSVNADSNGDWSVSFDLPCYCTPTKVNVYEGSKVTDSPVASQDITGLNCGITANKPEANCKTVKVSGTGVPGCPVTVASTFVEGACSLKSKTVTTDSNGDWTATLEVPCYCTPKKVFVFEGDKVTDAPDYSFDVSVGTDDGDCVPDFEADFWCDAVDVKGTGLIEGCDVTATVHIKADSENTGISPTCDSTYPVTLSASSPMKTVDLSGLPCGCEPAKVVFSYGDRFLGEITAGELNCICDDFTDVCKFEWYDDDRNEILFDGTSLDCNGGQVKFTNPTYKDGELVCFDFESDFPVFEVFVKGGGGPDAGNTYTWPCGTMDSSTAPSKITDANGNDITNEWDGQLCANEHPKNGQQTAVSHVTFRVCKDETLDNKPANG